MKTVTIIYYSKNGSTHSLAQALSKGVSDSQAQCHLYRIDPSLIVEGRFRDNDLWPLLDKSDAIVFGAPTYMGSAAAPFKAFMDATSDSYVKQAWNGKLAAGFTCGGSVNGEQQQTLLNFFALSCQHGMLWTGLDTCKHTDKKNLNRLGCSIGLVASHHNEDSDKIHPIDLATAEYLGQRIVTLLGKQ